MRGSPALTASADAGRQVVRALGQRLQDGEVVQEAAHTSAVRAAGIGAPRKQVVVIQHLAREILGKAALHILFQQRRIRARIEGGVVFAHRPCKIRRRAAAQHARQQDERSQIVGHTFFSGHFFVSL